LRGRAQKRSLDTRGKPRTDMSSKLPCVAKIAKKRGNQLVRKRGRGDKL